MGTTADSPRTPAEAVDRYICIGLLRTFARALHEVGMPTHRLEQTIVSLAGRLGVPLQVMAMPTGILVSFEEDGFPLTFVIRTRLGRVDLRAWNLLICLADDIVQGKLAPAAAKARIEAITKSSSGWSKPATVAAYVLSAGAFSVFFGGGTIELVVSLCVGLVVGIASVGMRSVRVSSRLFELVASAAAGFVVFSIDTPLGSFAQWVPLAAGLIILLPGIMLVDAVEELAHGHLVAGGARMAGVGVVFLAMTFGVLVGSSIGELVPGPPIKIAPLPLDQWTLLPALMAVALGSTIRFRARPRDYWLIFVGSAVALGASRFGIEKLGLISGAFLGAFALGLTGRLFARLDKVTPELLIIPGLALLVPGSLGVRSISALLEETSSTEVAIQTSFQMFMVAMALVAGLLFSNSLARERPSA